MTLNVQIDTRSLPFRPATELLAAIRERRISARALLDLYLERISRFNPSLNAIIHLDTDSAR
ncbi:hypothetical protein, partial [Serratia marcescens]|uniref:hypothetical protein n=1 Tax=Serratia marcescens TaxID=615 RepID=UPI0019535801